MSVPTPLFVKGPVPLKIPDMVRGVPATSIVPAPDSVAALEEANPVVERSVPPLKVRVPEVFPRLSSAATLKLPPERVVPPL